MYIRKVLINLGYKSKEVDVYRASLAYGEATISELATKVKMPRTSVQIIVQKLRLQGLIDVYVRKKRKLWVASSPKKLLKILQEKQAELEMILPELEAQRESVDKKPKIRIYTGSQEVKLLLSDMLLAKSHIFGVAHWDQWIHHYSLRHVTDFLESCYAQNLGLKLLVPKTEFNLNTKKTEGSQLRITKFLPDNMPISDSKFIYGKKIVIVSLQQAEPLGIVIEDEDIQNSTRLLLENLWDRS